jgi:general secretion pathway protein D
MGGLIEDRIVKTEDRIPLLGDIPVLGLPFRKTQNEKKKTELVIFLTPTVISGEYAEKIPQMERESYSEYLIMSERISKPRIFITNRSGPRF